MANDLFKDFFIFYLVPVESLKYFLPDDVFKIINFDSSLENMYTQFTDTVSIPKPDGSYLNLNKWTIRLIIVWMIIACLYITYQSLQYLYFWRTLMKNAVLIGNEDAYEALKKFPELKHRFYCRQIKVYQNPDVKGPLTAGVFSPCIILPKVMYNPKYSQDIYGHELYHIKNRDVLLKGICLIAIGFHWYNPFAYLLFWQVCRISEHYCDECIIKDMNREKRLQYGRL